MCIESQGFITILSIHNTRTFILNLFIRLQNCSFIIIYSSLEMISELDVSESIEHVSESSQYVSELNVSETTR